MQDLIIDHAYLLREVEAMRHASPYVFVEVLCHSLMGREIPLLRLGEGKRRVLYVGAHHGMEWITAGVLLDFVADFIRTVTTRGSIYSYNVESFIKERQIVVVPMLNPDGVEYSLHGVEEENPLYARLVEMNGGTDFSRWQANGRGVDLNHNYNAGFFTYKMRECELGLINGAPTRYSGEYPESEIETAALCRLLRCEEENFCGVLTLHTQGEEIFCSCADKMTAKCLSVGRVLQRLTGYRLASPEGLAAFGGLSDWCIEALSLPSFTLECGKGQNPLPTSQRAQIFTALHRALYSFPFML